MTAPANLAKDLDFRAKHVGSGEVAALFDECPYLTHFELWHRKNGTIDTPAFDVVEDGVPEDERIYWGIRLEEAILNAAVERFGYTHVERHPVLSNGRGLGAHPDALAYCPVRKSRGYLEIKTVDWLTRRGWGDEPPLHYLLQSQTGMGLADASWGDVLVLVGGNKLERFQYDARPKIYADIERRTVDFWASVKAGKAPSPDYTRDGDTLATVYRDISLEKVDLAGNNLAAAAAAEYQAASAEERAAAKRKDAAKAELIHKIGEAAGTAGELPPAKKVLALLPGFTVSATLIDEIADRPAEPGEIIKGRKAYRRLTIKESTEHGK